jgi:AcrR family transcriptional regulator
MERQGRGRRAEHADDTRTAVLAAARRLFAAEGYDGTGTEQIVAEARVTRGALYHHFRDKADLFRAVMEEAAGDVAQQLIGDRLDEAPGSPLAGIQAGISAFLDVCAGRDFQRIVLSDGPRVLGSEAWDQLVERHGRSILEEWLSWAVTACDIEPVPVRPLARLLIAMLAEASVAIALADDPAAARAEMVTTVSRLLSGLRGPG